MAPESVKKKSKAMYALLFFLFRRCFIVRWLVSALSVLEKPLTTFYSHSMVAGGFELMSYVTRFTPFTLLIILLETLPKNS